MSLWDLADLAFSPMEEITEAATEEELGNGAGPPAMHPLNPQPAGRRHSKQREAHREQRVPGAVPGVGTLFKHSHYLSCQSSEGKDGNERKTHAVGLHYQALGHLPSGIKGS